MSAIEQTTDMANKKALDQWSLKQVYFLSLPTLVAKWKKLIIPITYCW